MLLTAVNYEDNCNCENFTKFIHMKSDHFGSQEGNQGKFHSLIKFNASPKGLYNSISN